MVKEQNPDKKDVIITVAVLVFVVVAGSYVAISDYKEKQEFREVARLFCHDRGYEYAYSSGSIIHCYTQDEQGVRTAYDFWVDKAVCTEQYRGEVR